MQNTAPRRWGDNSTAASRGEKIDGVTDALERSSWDQPFRDRLRSQDAEVRKEALREGGKFESLPANLQVRCFEETEIDNHVHLVLPEFAPLGQGETPVRPNAVDYWLCTWFPYKPRP